MDSPSPVSSEALHHTADASRDRWNLLWLIVLLAIVHGAVLHPYLNLVGGDGDFYLAIARNLLAGEGFRHNGQPIAMIPPGWPLILAGLMQISTSVLWLKSVTAGMTIGFCVFSYLVARRIGPPGVCFWSSLLVGVLGPVVAPMTTSFYSEPPFCLLAAVAMWLACRINEDRAGPAKGWLAVIALCLVSVIALSVRWTGLVMLPVLGAILLNGRLFWRPRLDMRWGALLLVGVTVLAGFVGLRKIMRVDMARVDPRYPAVDVGAYDLVNQSEPVTPEVLAVRSWHMGRYLTWMLWEPAGRGKLLRFECNVLAWVMILSCIAAAVVLARRRNWILLGVFTFWLPIALNWPQQVGRYIMPILPFVVVGAVIGIVPLTLGVAAAVGKLSERVAECLRGWAPRIATVVTAVFFVGTFAGNGVLWAMQAYVSRVEPVYAYADGGTHLRLPAVARHLTLHPEGEVAVSFARFGRSERGRHTGYTYGWQRALHMLTARPVHVAPRQFSRDPSTSPTVADWARSRGVRWYVYIPPQRQFFHFRGGTLSAALKKGGDPWAQLPEEWAKMHWRLYEITDNDVRPVDLAQYDPKQMHDWLRHVPGLSETFSRS